MLVIHPQDRTTAVLQVLYKGLGEQVVTGDCSNRKIEHLFTYIKRWLWTRRIAY